MWPGSEGFLPVHALCLEFCQDLLGGLIHRLWAYLKVESARVSEDIGGDSAPGGGEKSLEGEMGKPQSQSYLLRSSPRAHKNC